MIGKLPESSQRDLFRPRLEDFINSRSLKATYISDIQ